MILLDGGIGRLVPSAGPLGVIPANFAALGTSPSPLANDADLPADSSTQWLWVLTAPLVASGTTDANDAGGYSLVGAADGVWSQGYRGLTMAADGTVVVYAANIQTTVAATGPFESIGSYGVEQRSPIGRGSIVGMLTARLRWRVLNVEPVIGEAAIDYAALYLAEQQAQEQAARVQRMALLEAFSAATFDRWVASLPEAQRAAITPDAVRLLVSAAPTEAPASIPLIRSKPRRGANPKGNA